MTHSARFPSLLLGSLAALAVAAGTVVAPATTSSAEASTISSFDAGNIITDADMFTYTTMPAGRIQAFLDEKVPACDAAAAAPCLKDFRADTFAIAGIGDSVVDRGCHDDLPARANQSAAEIIAAVAQACRVNPQVLIVTLQKEQGLVTSTSPTPGKYTIAMGYGCPDSAKCDSTYYGFYNQVYWAARAFQSYTRFPDSYNFRVGQTAQVQYSPTKSCGTKTVQIQNAATAALYNYTPYTPNDAAIAAGVGSVGDSCSSYGNRNFWGYYYAWFGPVEDQVPYFVKDASTKQIFLVIDGKRRPVESVKEKRGIALSVGISRSMATLSHTVVTQIGTVGKRALVPGTIVTASTGSSSLWLIDGLNSKRPISASRAVELTGSSKARVVEKSVLSKYSTDHRTVKLGLRVGNEYWVADHGILRPIDVTDVARYKKRFGFGTYDLSTINALTTGARIGALLKSGGQYYFVKDGRAKAITTTKYKQLVRAGYRAARSVDAYFLSQLKH